MGMWDAIKSYWSDAETVERKRRGLDSQPRTKAAPAKPKPSASPRVARSTPTPAAQWTSPSDADYEQRRAEGIENSVYLHSDLWASLLVPNENGMPPLRFQEHNGRLWLREDTTGKLVKVANRKLRGLGIWSVKVRGGKYRPEAVKATKIGLYRPVRLVREPDNPHDPNAVAVHTEAGHVGYFNKQMAAGLAKVLDAGVELEAIMTSRGEPINVVAASPEIMAHLRRT